MEEVLYGFQFRRFACSWCVYKFLLEGQAGGKRKISLFVVQFLFSCSATKLKLFNRTSQEINNQQASNIEIEIDDNILKQEKRKNHSQIQ